ncbi:MAG: peptidylprolyl isomerase [Candidatus Marinimicrobia bacterium]|nr:peptidylprolyl isomerase [Candidatus Neomarinimicrobiota bacterium]
MMTTLRNRMHIVLWTLLALFLLSMTVGGLVGGANIIDQLLGRVSPSEAIGSVNGSHITPDQFNQAVNVRMEALRNSGTEISDLHIDAIREEVWNAFIEEKLTEQAMEDLDITVMDDEILYHLENNPPIDIQRLFFVNNEFNEENYHQALNTPGMLDWAPIEAWMRDYYIPRFKLQQHINMSAVVSREEVREEFLKRTADYTISALHIATTAIEDQIVKPTEKELLADYKSRLADFEQDEKRHLSYVSWAKTPANADTLQIKEEALAIIMEYSEGKEFSVLANIHSQDPGNQVTPDSGRGGELGWVGKGQMVGPFDEAVFKAKSGSVVGPVLTQFGYHIIKVDSIRNNGKDNHQVKASHILLKIDLGQNTRTELRRKATLFSYDAQDYGFEAALDSHGVQSLPIKSLGEKDMFIGSLGAFRSAVRWAYNSEKGTISDPMESDNFYAVFTLDSVIPAGVTSFDDVRTQVYASITRNMEISAAEKLTEALKEKVRGGASFESLKQDNDKLDFVPSDTKKLSSSFISLGRSNHVVGALLNANEGDLIGPVKTFRGYGLIKVKGISAFDSTAWDIQKDLVRLDLTRQKQIRTYQSWMANLRDKAEIVDNRKYFF